MSVHQEEVFVLVEQVPGLDPAPSPGAVLVERVQFPHDRESFGRRRHEHLDRGDQLPAERGECLTRGARWKEARLESALDPFSDKEGGKLAPLLRREPSELRRPFRWTQREQRSDEIRFRHPMSLSPALDRRGAQRARLPTQPLTVGRATQRMRQRTKTPAYLADSALGMSRAFAISAKARPDSRMLRAFVLGSTE